MFTRSSCSAMLLLALPIVALADPVTVTTHLTGLSTTDNTILMGALGLNGVTNADLLPYDVTLKSTFDPDKDPLPPTQWAYDYGGEVVIDFRIGSQVYHYEGPANSSAYRTSSSVFDSYEHHLWFNTPGPSSSNYTVHFYDRLYYLPGSMGLSGPLTPLDADESSGESVFGYFSLNAYPSNPNVPLSWSMEGVGTTESVRVPAVPEPAPFAHLAVGLLTLGLRMRLRRR